MIQTVRSTNAPSVRSSRRVAVRRRGRRPQPSHGSPPTLASVTTVFLGDHPGATALIERRRELGIDGHDEVWKGVYYVTPHADSRHSVLQAQLVLHLGPRVAARGLRIGVEFNLGEPEDFRVPDLGVHAGPIGDLYLGTALAVAEVLSPHDRSLQKFAFYAAHDVQEVIVVDPEVRSVVCHALVINSYEERPDIACAGITCAELESLISWP